MLKIIGGAFETFLEQLHHMYDTMQANMLINNSIIKLFWTNFVSFIFTDLWLLYGQLSKILLMLMYEEGHKFVRWLADRAIDYRGNFLANWDLSFCVERSNAYWLSGCCFLKEISSFFSWPNSFLSIVVMISLSYAEPAARTRLAKYLF